MHAPWIVLSTVLLAAAPLAGPEEIVPPPADSVTLPQCLVSLIEEAKVPAQEAGILVELDAREGQQVKAGELLGRVDDAQIVLAEKVARLKLNVAEEKATNDIDVRYAKAAADVSKAEYEQALRLNEKTAGTITDTEVRRLLLTARRAVLAIEQAELDLRVAGLESQVQQGEVAAAAEGVRRRKITSPLDGEVVEVSRHVGEWVQPGDPVVHIVRMDRLRIEGLVNSQDRIGRDGRVVARGHDRTEVVGRPVSLTVDLAAGRRASFRGKVVFVNPMDEAGGQYRVWAEVENRKVGGQWLLSPGHMAEMTIHLK
jgi:multidrug efflux pump subunit AcrA (membrane-fusion protein)